jgi:RNA ligase (TIGR02306 family)
VLEVSSIEGADAIEKITVLGWELVAKKGEFSPGDLVVYCEVDSVLPERPEFEFLRSVKFRIKTRRMRGQISQGIAFPLDIIRNICNGAALGGPPENQWETCHRFFPGKEFSVSVPLKEGQDVSEYLEVTKYDPPEEDSGLTVDGQPGQSRKKGSFPDDLHKTDETRIQAVPGVLQDAQGMVCYVAEKVDGSSSTYILRRDPETNTETFHVCSRNQEKAEGPFCHFWAAAKRQDMQTVMSAFVAAYKDKFPKGIALQGELCGPGVQKNKLQLPEHKVFFFNAVNLDTGKFLDFNELVFALGFMNLPMVPVLDSSFVIGPETTVQSLVSLATRKSSLNPKVWAEGIVVRPLVEGYHRKLGRFSFKAINPEFLLKNGD